MKIFKKMTALLVASVTAVGGYLSLPLAKIVANAEGEPTTVAEVVNFSVLGVPTEHDLADSATVDNIPSGVFPQGFEGARRIYNGVGRLVFDSTKDTQFKPQSAGNYTIVYGYMKDGEFHRISGDYTLTVTGTKQSLSLKENEEFFLPSKVPATNGQKVNIPMPVVTLSNGTTVNPGETNYPEVMVTVKNVKANENLNLTTENNHKVLALSATSTKGVYEVRYSYDDAVLTKQFEVVDADSINTKDLGYTATISSWSETAQRYKGEEITLPTVTVKDSNGTDVTNETYTKITVNYIEVNGENKTTITSELANSADYFVLNGNKLTLYKNAESGASHYEIKYTVVDYFGNTVKNVDFNITNVSRYRNNPVVYLVDSYTDETNSENIVSIEDALPTIYNLTDGNNEITIPAMYAEDDYGSEFTYSRTYQTPSTSSATEFEAKYNEATTLTVDKAGTYTIRYTATSKLTGLTNSTNRSFTIVVKSADNAVESKPELTIPTIPSVVKVGETIDIGVATAKDVDENNDVVDEKVTITVSDNLTPVYENHTLKGYTYTGTQKGEDTVVFTATNDNGVSVSQSAKITVLAQDEIAPTLEVVENYNTFESEVYLPMVKFNDQNNDNEESDSRFTNVYVQVFDPNGNEVNGIKGVKYSYKTNTVYGGSFTASLTGTYKIVYTAIDAFNNSSSMMIVTTEVNGTSKYVQSGLKSTFPDSVQPGEVVKLPEPVIMLNGEEKDVDYSIELIDGPGVATISAFNEFSAKTEGKYELVYMLDGEEISSHYFITVSDTVAPELNIRTKDLPSTVVDYDSENPEAIYIPLFFPSDNVKVVDYNIVIKRNGTEFEKLTKADIDKLFEEKGDDLTAFSFTPTNHGEYTFVYSATDASGNKTTSDTYKVSVGDVTAPTLEFKATVPATVDVGYTLTFADNDIVVTDDRDNATYTVKVTNSAGKELSNTGAQGKYAYKLESAGEYTLKIEANDNNGHTTTVTKTITVSSEAHNTSTSTEVIGIILIVVSLLILGGVVFYFIKTRDRKPKIDTTTND